MRVAHRYCRGRRAASPIPETISHHDPGLLTAHRLSDRGHPDPGPRAPGRSRPDPGTLRTLTAVIGTSHMPETSGRSPITVSPDSEGVVVEGGGEEGG